ncbi:unnamed protein product [Amaranthus hypochondriacus]
MILLVFCLDFCNCSPICLSSPEFSIQFNCWGISHEDGYLQNCKFDSSATVEPTLKASQKTKQCKKGD